jgi:hypothetical protein
MDNLNIYTNPTPINQQNPANQNAEETSPALDLFLSCCRHRHRQSENSPRTYPLNFDIITDASLQASQRNKCLHALKKVFPYLTTSEKNIAVKSMLQAVKLHGEALGLSIAIDDDAIIFQTSSEAIDLQEFSNLLSQLPPPIESQHQIQIKYYSATALNPKFLKEHGHQITLLACSPQENTTNSTVQDLIESCLNIQSLKIRSSELNHNNLDGLSNLKNLHTLDLSWCDSLSTLTLSELPNLQTLNLAYCNIKKLTLSQLPNLQTLNLSCCKSLAAVSLCMLPNLQIADLPRCSALTALSLSQQPNLKALNLSHCVKLTTLTLSQLPTLQTLNLSYCCNLTAASLSPLPGIQSIDLQGYNSATDDVRLAFFAAIFISQPERALNLLPNFLISDPKDLLSLLMQAEMRKPFLSLPPTSCNLLADRLLAASAIPFAERPQERVLALLPLYSPEEMLRSVATHSLERWRDASLTFNTASALEQISGTVPSVLRMIKENYLNNDAIEERDHLMTPLKEGLKAVAPQTIAALVKDEATIELALTFLPFMEIYQKAVAIALMPTRHLISFLSATPVGSHPELFSLMTAEQKEAYLSAILLKSQVIDQGLLNSVAELETLVEQQYRAPTPPSFENLFMGWTAQAAQVRMALETHRRILHSFDRALDLFNHRNFLVPPTTSLLATKNNDMRELQERVEAIGKRINQLCGSIQSNDEGADRFLDPMTMALMNNPMSDRHGNILDESTWKACGKNPYTRESLEDSELTLETALKTDIDEYRKSLPPNIPQ